MSWTFAGTYISRSFRRLDILSSLIIIFGFIVFTGCDSASKFATGVDEITGTVAEDTPALPTIGTFSISGITAPSGDSTFDAVLSNSLTAVVSYTASTDATSYDVGIYSNDGTTVVCAVQNTASLSVDFSSCTLTAGQTYKASVRAKLGTVTKAASNNLFSFRVNRSPIAGSGGLGPWYVLQGGSITINALWVASPAVGIATDADGDAMTFSAVGTGVLGAAANNTTSITFTAAASAYGKETLSFTIVDAAGGTYTTNVIIHVVTAFTWTGVTSNIWNSGTATNWCGSINANKNGCTGTGTVPNTADIAVIDNTCSSANCSPTTNYAVSVKGIRLAGSALTQGTGQTLTVGTSGWQQTAGIFTGSNSAISFSAAMSVTGGLFTSTSNTLTSGEGGITIGSATYFAHNSGKITFNCGSGNSRTVSASGVTFNNIDFTGYGDVVNFSAPINVIGTLRLMDTYFSNPGAINGSQINLSGNLVGINPGKPGSTIIRLVGSTSQSITGDGGSPWLPNIEIASTGGTVTFVSSMRMNRNFTVTTGTVDFGTSTVNFTSDSLTQTITGTGLNFYNVAFDGYGQTISIASPITVTGTLSLADQWNGGGSVNGAAINVTGNISLNNNGKNGNAPIKVVGSTNQTISGVSGSVSNLEIASTGGTVTFTGTVKILNNFTHTLGALDFGTSTIEFGSNGVSRTIAGTGLQFYNLTFHGWADNTTLSSAVTVNGTLRLADQYYASGNLNGAAVHANGNVVVADNGILGSSLIRLTGSSNQLVTGTSGLIMSMEIASTGGVVSFAGNLQIAGNFTYTLGSVDFGTSTLLFGSNATSRTISASGLDFYNLKFNGYGDTTTISAQFSVLGTLTLENQYYANSMNGSSILAKGNVVTTSNGHWGSTVLWFAGNTNTTLSCGSGAFPGAQLTIAKTGGAKLSLATNCTLSSSTQDLNIQSGELDLAGYNLTVNDQLIVDVGAILTASGGTYTPNSGGNFTCSGTCNP